MENDTIQINETKHSKEFMRFIVPISSVQREFAAERQMFVECVLQGDEEFLDFRGKRAASC